MPAADALVSKLARAYGLSGLVPVGDARVRRLLQDAAEALTGDQGIELRVSDGWIRGPEGLLGDAEDLTGELARDLEIAGVAGLRLPAGVSVDALATFVAHLREGAGSGNGTHSARALAHELPEIGVEFSEEGARGRGPARSLDRLFAALPETTPPEVEAPAVEPEPPAAPEEPEAPPEPRAAESAGPSTPAEPTEPAEPVEPVEPVEPAEPFEPEEPAAPAESAEPVEASAPAVPPSEPDAPTTSEDEPPPDATEEAAPEPEAAEVVEAAEPPAAPQPPPDPEPVEPVETTEPPAAGELASEEGPPAEAAGAEEGTDVAALVTAYLGAPSGEREGAADRIRARAEALRQDGAFGEVAAGVLELARAGIDDAGDGEALELAREILVPGVGTRIALDLGEVREEGERDRMIEIVARLGDAMAAPISEALADASDRAARRAYIEAMVALGSSVEEQVLGMIEDSRWFVVRNGVAVLGRIGDDRAIEHLTSTLAHEDLRVRRETVLALAKLGGENAGALALGMIDDPEAEVRAATAMALGELEMEKAVRPLRKRLEEEDDEDVQVQILRALGQLGDPGAVPEIEKHAVASFFSRPPRPVRIAAYKALSEIGTPHALKLLEKAVDDKDSEIRVAVRGMLKSLEEEKEAEATG